MERKWKCGSYGTASPPTKFNGVSHRSTRSRGDLLRVGTGANQGDRQLLSGKCQDYSRDDAAGLAVYGRGECLRLVKTPNNLSSWDFFDKLLHTANVVGTPGSGAA